MTDVAEPDEKEADTMPHWAAWIVRSLIALVIVVGAAVSLDAARLYQSRHNGDVLAIIRDTVDPGGARYRAGQIAQARALSFLEQSNRDANAVAIFCAHAVPSGDVAQIKTCVDDEFAKLRATQTTVTTKK